MPREFRLQQIIFADGKASLRGRDRLADFEGPVRDAGARAIDLADLLPAAQRARLAAIHKKFTDRIERQVPPGVAFTLRAVIWNVDSKELAFEGVVMHAIDNTPLGVRAIFMPLRMYTLADARASLSMEMAAMGISDEALAAVVADANVLDADDLADCERIVTQARQRAAVEEWRSRALGDDSHVVSA